MENERNPQSMKDRLLSLSRDKVTTTVMLQLSASLSKSNEASLSTDDVETNFDIVDDCLKECRNEVFSHFGVFDAGYLGREAREVMVNEYLRICRKVLSILSFEAENEGIRELVEDLTERIDDYQFPGRIGDD